MSVDGWPGIHISETANQISISAPGNLSLYRNLKFTDDLMNLLIAEWKTFRNNPCLIDSRSSCSVGRTIACVSTLSVVGMVV